MVVLRPGLSIRRRQTGRRYAGVTALIVTKPGLSDTLSDFYFFPQTAGGYTLTAASGSYSATGQAANLLASRILTADQGVYTYTGQAAGLGKSFTLTASGASCAYTGIAASPVYNRVLTAAQGSYTVTGQSAALGKSYLFIADGSSYSLTGVDAALIGNRRLTADTGAYAYTGNDAGIGKAFTFTADAAAYTSTGYAAGFSITLPPVIAATDGPRATSQSTRDYLLLRSAYAGSNAREARTISTRNYRTTGGR